jgi:Salmonella virulence plasmid 65kDa B protein
MRSAKPVHAMTNAPQDIICLPKGGGAVTGIGETFSADLHTGTGNFSIPIALPAGRNGFQPKLVLKYSTGQGNGPFGLGWALDIPHLTRKTSDGVPQFDDNDTFMLSGMEDLVAVETLPGKIRYQPRTEGSLSLWLLNAPNMSLVRRSTSIEATSSVKRTAVASAYLIL